MKIKLTLLCALLLVGAGWLSVRPVASTARTDVPGGPLAGNTTWTAAESPYRLLGSVTVPSGATLTIEAGVTVYLQSVFDSLTVADGGKLVAQGTAVAPIAFTAEQAGSARWDALIVESGGQATLSHCEISRGGWPNGGGNGALTVRSSDVVVESCVIQNGGDEGISVEGDGITPIFRNVEIRDNRFVAIYHDNINMQPHYENLTVSGNGDDHLFTEGGDVTLAKRTFTAIGVPYVVDDAVNVLDGSELSIEAGVVWQMTSAGDWLRIMSGATLNAIGTPLQPIVLTGRDAGSSTWDSVVIEAGAAATLQHCEISNGGWPNGGGNGALTVRSSDVVVESCVIQNGGDEGISVEGDGITPIFRNVEIRDNRFVAIYHDNINMQPHYENLTVSGNGDDHLFTEGGDVTLAKRTFTAIGVPYVVDDAVNVLDGSELSIEAGVVWQMTSFGGWLRIRSGATLNAIGTPLQPIVLTGRGAGSSTWDSVVIEAGAAAALQHCEISKGGWPNGGGDGAVHILSSDVTISDCKISDGGDEGIVLDGEGLTPLLRNLIIEDNGRDAVRQSTLNMQPLYDNISVSGNGKDAIVLPGGTLSGTLATFVAAGAPYEIGSTLTVPDGSTLTIEPGVTLRFDSFGDQLWVDAGGTLDAVGTQGAPIIVTGTSGLPRGWQNIFFAVGSAGSLQYCEVSNGGWWATANDQQIDGLIYIASSDVSVRDCYIHHSDRWGLRVDMNAQPTIKDNVIADNPKGLVNKTPATVVDASLNYWGAATGPFHPDLNPTGEGNEVSDGVLFNPWYSSSQLVEVDLALTSVAVAAHSSINDDLEVTYVVKNVSSNLLTGGWTDSIYLSRDSRYSPDDVLLTRVLHTADLAAGATVEKTSAAPLANLDKGRYYVIVIADSRRIVPDGNRQDNTRASSNAVQITIPRLKFGEMKSGVLGSDGRVIYQIEVAAGSDALFVADFDRAYGGELYLAHGRVPTPSDFDAAASDFEAAKQRLLLPQAAGGSWYVLLYGGPNASSYTLTAESNPLLLAAISPSRGGDKGMLTVEVQGAGFDDATTLRLRRGGASLQPVQLESVDAYTLIATFDLAGRPQGVYDVVVTTAAGSAEIEDGFEVVEGVGGVLSASLVLPSGARPNRPFRAVVDYRNSGDADLDVPLLRVDAPEGAGLFPDGFDQEDADGSLQFLATPDGYFSNGTLGPGEEGQFEFWALIGPDSATVFTLTERTTDDSVPLDLDALEAQVRPVGGGPDLWDDAWAIVEQQIGGNTYGDLVVALTAAADEAHGYGVELRSMRALLSYMLERAYLQLPADVRGKLFVEQGGQLEPLAQRFIYLAADLSADAADAAAFGATTWYDGSFAIRDVEAQRYAVAVVGFNNAAPQTMRYAGSPIDDLTVIVQPAGTLYGAVRGANWYEYAAGALISVHNLAGDLVATGEADEWGRYRITNLPIDELLIVTVSGAELPPPAPQQVLLIDETEQLLDIEMAAGGSVAGTVRAPDGAPLADAVVLVTSADGRVTKRATTDGSGGYSVQGLPIGVATVVANADTHAPVAATTLVTVDDVATVDLQLRPAGTLQLTVRDADDNRLLAGVAVGVNVDGIVETLATDENGKVTLSGLPAGVVTATFNADTYLYLEQAFTVVAGASRSHTVALAAAGTIEGVLRAAGGPPWAGASVTLLAGGLEGGSMLTTLDGRFSFAGVPAGSYLLRIGNDSGGGALYRQVVLDAAQPSADLTIELDAAELSGTLRSGDGARLGNGYVTLLRNGHAIATTAVDGGGGFRFFVQQAGEYELLARVDGDGVGRLPNIDVTPGSNLAGQDVIIEGGRFRLSVTQGGQPVSGGTVTLRRTPDADRPAHLVAIDATGVAELLHLPHGTYDISIHVPGSGALAFTHLHSGDSDLARALGSAHTISGRVSAIAGGGLPYTLVVLQQQGSRLSLTTVSDSSGNYSLAGIPAGTYDIWITAVGGALRATRQQNVVIGGDVTLNVAVAGDGATVDGSVTDLDGNPIPNAIVRVEDSNGTTIAAGVSAIDGSYTIRYLPNGTFTLIAQASGYSWQQQALAISGLGDVSRPITLSPVAVVLSASEGEAGARVTRSFSTADISGVTQPTRFPIDSNYYDTLDSFALDDIDKITQETVEAEFKFRRTKKMADLRFDELRTSYRLTRDTIGANVTLQGLQATQITAKITALLGALRLGEGVSYGFNLNANVSLATADVIGAYRSGSIDALGLGLDALSIEMAAIGDAAANEGNAVAVISIANDIKNLLNQIPADQQEATSLQLQWLAKSNDYADAAGEMQEALNEMQSAFKAACGSGSSNEPPIDEPDKPRRDEENAIEQDETERRVSRDPNDIVGPDGFGPQRYVPAATRFDYTILFENVADATAPAQIVTIEHVVDADLDYSTFTLGDFGFGDLYFPVPAGRRRFSARLDLVSEHGVYVEYSADFNPVSGVATWTFFAVDPTTGDLSSDPTIGFLPPNVVAPEGEGFVRFWIKPKAGLATGTTIDAQAEIVFDDNAPIVTEIYRNTIDASRPQSRVTPLAAASGEQFTVRWSGSDAGAGIVAYDLYVRVDGGEWRQWLDQYSGSSAIYAGTAGRRYEFYSVAVDGAGLTEAKTAVAEASTVARAGYRLYLPIGVQDSNR